MPDVDDNTAIVFVLGLGCHASTEEWCTKTKNKLKTKDFTCICNPSLSVTLSQLTSICMFRKSMSKTTPIVREVVDIVCQKLALGKSVHLMGHSYGGAVVSMAAIQIWEMDPSASLQLSTYGSVYTPFDFPGDKGDTNVFHTLFENDNVALSCNGLRPNTPVPPCVIWLVKVGKGGIRTHNSYSRNMIIDAEEYMHAMPKLTLLSKKQS